MSAPPSRRSKLYTLATRAIPGQSHTRQRSNSSHQPLSAHESSRRLQRTPSPSVSGSDHTWSNSNHHNSISMPPESVNYGDDLAPPTVPFAPPRSANADGSGLSSRRSSFSSDKGSGSPGGLNKTRPSSLSVNYVPAKFGKLHAPGDHAARRAKTGGGRDAFARDAQRMGMMGTVDDDEGVVFQVGKGGLKRKNRPKLRWNRFKWVLFAANTVLFVFGLATLVSAILVWLNVFYQSDVIRVGNRIELIISTTAAAMCVLTSLMGYAGVVLNNRAFLAVYTLLLWICLALLVTPGYLTYKQRTFNLEGKINSQWSRVLGTDGRLRIQDALRCCGYFSPYVEATISPLCYARSNFPGCKNKYLRLERSVLQKWYIISFSLVPAQILIIVASLLCSNHITYRFGKGLTPKRYRLDLGSMAVIMDEYASQIAAQYGPHVAAEAKSRSSTYNVTAYDYGSPNSSRRGSFVSGQATGAQTNITKPISRTGNGGSHMGSQALYDPAIGSFEAGSRGSGYEAEAGSPRWENDQQQQQQQYTRASAR